MIFSYKAVAYFYISLGFLLLFRKHLEHYSFVERLKYK